MVQRADPPMREAFAATATELLVEDPRVAIVLAEISRAALPRRPPPRPRRAS